MHELLTAELLRRAAERPVSDVDSEVAAKPPPGWDRSSAALLAAAALFAKPRHATGYFTAFDRRGHQLGVLIWLDVDDGRYVMSDHRGGNGERYGTIAPADERRLTTRLAELFDR